MSFATILIPGSGIAAAYTDATEFHNALGIYLITWFIVTFLLLIAALRKNAAFIALFAFLSATFIVLAVANFSINTKVQKAGGALGILTAMIAYYAGLSELLAAEKQRITSLPLGSFSSKQG
jgi:succinate-acetate transporter protein